MQKVPDKAKVDSDDPLNPLESIRRLRLNIVKIFDSSKAFCCTLFSVVTAVTDWQLLVLQTEYGACNGVLEGEQGFVQNSFSKLV